MDRILLVDDNPDNLQVLYQALETEGYELLIAQSGEEALTIAQEARPQLILLDINMPGMNGFEACRRLKDDARTQEAVVIFLSARDDVQDKIKGLEIGAVDYISKPFQFEEVVARVQTHLKAYHRHQQLLRRTRALETRPNVSSPFTEDELRSMIEGGENDRVEFKATLRINTHSNQPDKRIENAVLKTMVAFMNTDGGMLLIGVADDGVVLGLTPDRFANEDKGLLHFNNLIKNHVGLEFARFIRPSMQSVGGARILVVECLFSPKPVFLQRDKEELFFVRVGPSSQPLSPSKLLAYLENRKKAMNR